MLNMQQKPRSCLLSIAINQSVNHFVYEIVWPKWPVQIASFVQPAVLNPETPRLLMSKKSGRFIDYRSLNQQMFDSFCLQNKEAINWLPKVVAADRSSSKFEHFFKTDISKISLCGLFIQVALSQQ